MPHSSSPESQTAKNGGPEAAPARRSASRERKSAAQSARASALFHALGELASSYAATAAMRGLPMPDTSGLNSGGSSASAALQESLASRLQAMMDVSGSPEYELRWKSWDMPLGGGDLCAAGVGAPHIRQRLYWVGDTDEQRLAQRTQQEGRGAMGHEGTAISQDGAMDGNNRMGNAALPEGSRLREQQQQLWRPADWSEYDIIQCADGNSRRVERGAFPLAFGIPVTMVPQLTLLHAMGRSAIKAARDNRVIRLRGYGNAIVPQVAAKFIQAYRKARATRQLVTLDNWQ